MNAITSFKPITGSLVLDEMVAVIGWDATMRLVRAIGGTRLYVPLTYDALVATNAVIASAIGAEAGHQLCDIFHGTTQSIPIKLRREMHVRELAAFVPPLRAREIANEVGISERMVFHILAQPVGASVSRNAPDPRQPGLFDART